MGKTYYYSRGRRVLVSRLRSAQVVCLPEDRNFVSIPGWHSVPIGNKRFQMIVRADIISERALRVFKIEDLAGQLVEAEKKITNQSISNEERSLLEETDVQSIPVILSKDGNLLLPTGEIVAKFLSNLEIHEIEKEVQKRGGRIVRSLSFLSNTYLLQPNTVGDGIELANDLVEAGLVEFASPNFIEEMPWRAKDSPPNNLFPQQWHLNNIGQNGSSPLADVCALDAWRITTGSSNIIICILDSGIDSKHESFSTQGKLVPGFDFEDNDPLPYPTSSSHGTSAAGVAAGPWGIGRVVGIAPGCQIMPIRRSMLSEHLKMAEAFVWAADQGADIISCSFGYDNRPWILPDVVRAAIDYALENGRNKKGCIIVWAAGNGNELISTDEWASYEKVIAVGASTDQDIRATYSDFGPELDICAPSSGGINSITTTSIGGYTSLFGGTSSAAPLVAGVAALVLSVNPALTWNEVRDVLCHSADQIDPVNGMYDTNGHSYLYGYGKVNAFKALVFSVLIEVARKNNKDIRLQLIRQFADEFLMPRPAGQQILQFLGLRKFRIVELLKSNAIFSQNIITIMQATAETFEVIKNGRNLVIPDSTWEAVANVARLLLHVDENREERNVENEEHKMESNLNL